MDSPKKIGSLSETPISTLRSQVSTITWTLTFLNKAEGPRVRKLHSYCLPFFFRTASKSPNLGFLRGNLFYLSSSLLLLFSSTSFHLNSSGSFFTVISLRSQPLPLHPLHCPLLLPVLAAPTCLPALPSPPPLHSHFPLERLFFWNGENPVHRSK